MSSLITNNLTELENLNQPQEAKYVEVLSDIHFGAPKGKLVGICGHVGSGKSSLLLAALGQLRMTKGHILREGTCAYVSQQAWIVNGTFKENILFGEEFDAKRYYHTITICNLKEDLNMLPGGDDTEIGERGVNLSGGQKQRVALARAYYANRCARSVCCFRKIHIDYIVLISLTNALRRIFVISGTFISSMIP